MLVNIDEVATGVLVNAIAVAGRRLSAAFGYMPRRRREHDLTVARWFGTYELTSQLPDLPNLTAAAEERLAAILGSDEFQAALQELLAARLTDAPDTDATRAREVLGLTLIATDPEIVQALTNYYDDEICALVARLEADDPPLLTQIRADAFATRMVSILNAIERHTAALSARPSQRTESDFLARYRRHVAEQHGKLEPPDFDRRRRVPISDIYVPTEITKAIYSEQTSAPHSVPESLNVWQLANELDRSVLLGDPGGGKTTAASVLMHHFASDKGGRVPFLVTLWDYAAKDPPERSVVGYIEHTLATFYQCPPPPGLVDLLLLTGRAVVIFDGLDELIDTTRRRDVTTRVERFCAEYPLACVLVTSRLIGYDQAQLDDRQFTCYRLGKYGDEQIAQYVRKWFAQDKDAHPDDSEAFLTESASIPDLRSNPLLLSLMCILYRGKGSLPRSRAEVYEQCATLLFRNWDAHRRIHRDLRAGRFLEPALRHLAWLLFTRNEPQPAVTEHELITATAEFLHGRGFESEDDARDAAREFVEFCRGRLWVFSDAGTTATGEKLYSFTHRTFLEYFAAAHLAFASDTPELLARKLAPRIAHNDWEVVGELAVQVKDRTSKEGARRIYAELLGERRHRSAAGRSGVLQFLARTLRSVDPPPQTVRELARAVLGFLFADDPDSDIHGLPLAWLLASCGACRELVAEEISAWIAAMVASDAPATHLNGLCLATCLTVPLWGNWKGRGPDLVRSDPLGDYWQEQMLGHERTYESAIAASAVEHGGMRTVAVGRGFITVRQALAMPGDLTSLLEGQRMPIFGITWMSYLAGQFNGLRSSRPDRAVTAFTEVGHYLISRRTPPWVVGRKDLSDALDLIPRSRKRPTSPRLHLPPAAYLGAAGALLTSIESIMKSRGAFSVADPRELGPLRDLHDYIECRGDPASRRPLPNLPVPEEFKQIFRDWAEGRVNLIAQTDDAHPDVNTATGPPVRKPTRPATPVKRQGLRPKTV